MFLQQARLPPFLAAGALRGVACYAGSQGKFFSFTLSIYLYLHNPCPTRLSSARLVHKIVIDIFRIYQIHY